MAADELRALIVEQAEDGSSPSPLRVVCAMTDDLRDLIDRRVRALLDLPLHDPIMHGTETAYVKLLCRCDPCRAAGTAARMRRKSRDPEANRAAQRRAYHLRKGREALPPPMPTSERRTDGPAV